MSLDFFRGQSYCLPVNAFSSVSVYTSIQSFYQYRMVPPTMSVLSNDLCQKLSMSEKDKLWNDLLEAAGVPNENFIFGSLLWSWEKEITALKLTDSTLACDQIKGVLCWESSLIEFGDKIHKLDVLFLRIRNAFAHGRIAALDGFLVFEDRDNLQQLTARIVLNEKTLLLWMNMIKSNYKVPKDDITVVENLDNSNSLLEKHVVPKAPKDDITVAKTPDNSNSSSKNHIVPETWIASKAIASDTILELKVLCDPADGQRLEKKIVGFYSGTYYIVPYQEPIKEELKRFLGTAYIPINQNRTAYVLEVYISEEESTILIPEDIFHFCEREIVLARKLITKRIAPA